MIRKKALKTNSPSETGMWVNVNRRNDNVLAFALHVAVFYWALSALGLFRRALFFLLQSVSRFQMHSHYNDDGTIKCYAMSYACAPIHMVAIYWLEIDKLYYDTRKKEEKKKKKNEFLMHARFIYFQLARIRFPLSSEIFFVSFPHTQWTGVQ